MCLPELSFISQPTVSVCAVHVYSIYKLYVFALAYAYT